MSDYFFTEEDEQLLGNQTQALKNIDAMIDVSDQFKETVRFIAHRLISNPYCRMFLFIIAQMSEMGTGFSGTFENGGTQSDRRDDVMLFFSEGDLKIRLRGDQLTWYTRQQDKRSVVFKPITFVNRRDLSESLDGLFAEWWGE